MTTLITGGGSKTGTALARLLTQAGHKVIFASRSGRVPDNLGSSVKLDWSDPSTFETPFTSDGGDKIRYVYLLPPPGTWNPLPTVQPFIDLAVKKGVERFVYLSAAGQTKGPDSHGLGVVHTYLDTLGVDYVTLRPTWFTENFLKLYGKGIREHSIIQTVCSKGRVPFVSVDDIGQVAFDAITNRNALKSNEPVLIGPDLVSYGEVAEIFSEILGRKITHEVITSDDLTRRYIAFGLPEQSAQALVKIEEGVEQGSEEKWISDPITLVGKVGVREWIEKRKDQFAVPA